MRKFIGILGGTAAGIATMLFLGLFSVGFNADLLTLLPGTVMIAGCGAVAVAQADENNDLATGKAAALGASAFAIIVTAVYLIFTLLFSKWTVAGMLADLAPNLAILALYVLLGAVVGAGYAVSANRIGTRSTGPSSAA